MPPLPLDTGNGELSVAEVEGGWRWTFNSTSGAEFHGSVTLSSEGDAIAAGLKWVRSHCG